MWDRPVVSLHGNGESVTLDNLAADWVLMQGAAGLGVSPVELSTAPLAGGGSVLQHRRFTEAEIVVPILLGRSRFMDRFEQRRTLERLCDGLVEIRIETAEGTRSRWGWYSDGLRGDYGEGEDSIDGQKLALTFLCLDQFWKGEEHSFVYKANEPKKPFLSVATNGRENLWDGKQLTDYTQSVWDVVDEGLEHAGEDRLAGLDLDDWKVEATEGTPFTVDLSLKFLTGDGKGRARITGVSYKDGSKLSEVTLMETNRSGRFGSSFYPAPGADAVSVGLYVGESMGRNQRVRVSNVVLWGPTGEAPMPEKAPPFFPVVLADSTVQGELDINVKGDSQVWPEWLIKGPGEDVLIENDYGDQIFIEGTVNSIIRIVTEPQRQAIRDEDGLIWGRVPVGQDVMFPLLPGKNHVKLSMVDGSPESSITVSWRENWKAGL